MNWEAVGVTVAIISTLIGLATAYLRLFVKNELSQLREELTRVIKDQYVSKEVYEARRDSIDRRLIKLEGLK